MTKPQFERIFDDTPVIVAYLFGSHAVGRALRAITISRCYARPK